VDALHSFSDRLGRWLGVVLIFLLATLILLATVETLAWAAFDLSWAASVEIQELLMVWLALLSGAWAVKEKLHLAVDLLVKRLPGPVQRGAARLAPAAVALFGVLLAIYGVQLMQAVSNTLPATGLPAAAGYLPTVAAGVLVAFFAVEQLFEGPR
jgi:TRAP-type C4-dicarboxylate transport system permease small subunit